MRKQNFLLICGCLVLNAKAFSDHRRTPILESKSQIGHQQHRRLFLNAIFEFLFGVLSSNLRTCRQVGDSFEQREKLDIFSYLIAITIGGETSGQCPVGNGEVGQVCNTDDDCIGSGVCRNRVCLASRDCNLLIHATGDPFDKDRINLIFVGSAFTSHQEFTNAVGNSYNTIKTYEFFKEDIAQYNVMYVLPSEGQKSGYCQQPCGGSDRLLCCDVNDSRTLSSRCFSSSTPNVQTLVLHNSPTYGGSAALSENVIAATIHPLGPLVVVHELGHTLFRLGDEYLEGPGTDFFPNCDNAGCRRWSDLLGRTIQGYNGVQCIGNACMGGAHFIGEKSYMKELTSPVGAVNARFACCAYLSLTKTTLSYCNKFEFSSGALLSYCRDNDYQRFGANTYTLTEGRVVDESTMFSISIPDNGNPIVTLEAVARRPLPNRNVIFFSSLDVAVGRVIVVEYKLSSANSPTLLFVSATTLVHATLPLTDEEDGQTPDSIRVDSKFLQIEVESNVVEIEFATAELVDLNSA